MDTEKLTFKEVLRRHWLLAGLYAFGTLIVLWITVNRIAEIPWRYYRYWQTVGVYLLVLGGYVGFDLLNLLLLRRSAWWRLLFLPSFLFFHAVLISAGPKSTKKDILESFRCQDNLLVIAMACEQYSNEFDVFPESLEQLRDLGYVGEKDLTCAGNPWHNPGDVDYLYFGRGVRKSEADPDKILAGDDPELHRTYSARRRSHARFDFSVTSD